MTPLEQWHLARWGKFTASMMDSLLVSAKNGAMFGDKAINYINDVASQAVSEFNEDENIETYSMKMGKANEPIAFYNYRQIIRVPLEYYGGDTPVFRPYNSDSGCSPDVVAYSNGEYASFGAQIKCPQRKEHFNNLRYVRTSDDLKRECRQHYTQCQFEMECYGCDLWHFVSFNDYFKHGLNLHIVEIKRDQEFLDNLLERLDKAIELKYQIINQLVN